MRYLSFFALIAYIAVAGPCFGQANSPQVAINNITADSVIDGTVAGLPAQAQGNACVVVYVHTDIWYIHPYASAGLGQSFTMIDTGGTWHLPTVRRQFPANKVAAIVMPSVSACQNVPDRTGALGSIQGYLALKEYDLKKDDDAKTWFGRL